MKTRWNKRAGFLAFLVGGLLLAAGGLQADTYVATGGADFRDGFLYQAYPANNYGGDTRIIIGKGTNTAYFREYLWFAKPSGINTNVVCTLAVYLSTLAANPDTFDLFWGTRANARLYVGNNAGATADSAEMDWERLFNNGSSATPPDTTWSSAGGDFSVTDTLGRRTIPGGSSAGWYYWVLDSVQVDSLLRGSRENYGVFVKGRATSALSTRMEGASTDNGNSGIRPWVKFVYVSYSAENNARRRRMIEP
jgi:hypothetical protein